MYRFLEKQLLENKNKNKNTAVSNCPLSTNHLLSLSPLRRSPPFPLQFRFSHEDRHTQTSSLAGGGGRGDRSQRRHGAAPCRRSPTAETPGTGGSRATVPPLVSRCSASAHPLHLFCRPALPTLPRLLNLGNSIGKLPPSFLCSLELIFIYDY